MHLSCMRSIIWVNVAKVVVGMSLTRVHVAFLCGQASLVRIGEFEKQLLTQAQASYDRLEQQSEATVASLETERQYAVNSLKEEQERRIEEGRTFRDRLAELEDELKYMTSEHDSLYAQSLEHALEKARLENTFAAFKTWASDTIDQLQHHHADADDAGWGDDARARAADGMSLADEMGGMFGGGTSLADELRGLSAPPTAPAPSHTAATPAQAHSGVHAPKAAGDVPRAERYLDIAEPPDVTRNPDAKPLAAVRTIRRERTANAGADAAERGVEGGVVWDDDAVIGDRSTQTSLSCTSEVTARVPPFICVRWRGVLACVLL